MSLVCTCARGLAPCLCRHMRALQLTSKLVLKATAFMRYAPCRLLPLKLAFLMSADVKLLRRRSCIDSKQRTQLQ